MERKYKVDFGGINYVFTCEPNELEREVKKTLKIEQAFQLQVYDASFREWLSVPDIEKLPTLSKMKVEISKCCAMHILQ